MKVINFKNAIVGTACAAIFMLCSSNVFGACAIPSCPAGKQLTYEGPNCYCLTLNNPMSGDFTQLQDTSINTNTKDFGITTGIITTTTPDASTECEVKQVGDDYTYCCKDEDTTETCETKGYQSGTSCSSGKTAKSYTVTLNGQNKTCYKCIISTDSGGGTGGGGCSNACYTNCSKAGGSVYYTQSDWHNSGGQQISASGCNTGNGYCFCVKGANSGSNTGLVVGPGGTGGGGLTPSVR